MVPLSVLLWHELKDIGRASEAKYLSDIYLLLLCPVPHSPLQQAIEIGILFSPKHIIEINPSPLEPVIKPRSIPSPAFLCNSWS